MNKEILDIMRKGLEESLYIAKKSDELLKRAQSLPEGFENNIIDSDLVMLMNMLVSFSNPNITSEDMGKMLVNLEKLITKAEGKNNEASVKIKSPYAEFNVDAITTEQIFSFIFSEAGLTDIDIISMCDEITKLLIKQNHSEMNDENYTKCMDRVIEMVGLNKPKEMYN